MVLKLIQERFKDSIVDTHEFRGDLAVVVKREDLLNICEFLRHTKGLEFNMLVDICGVDYLDRDPRFDVVYHLYSIRNRRRVRLKVRLPEDDPRVDSVYGVWKGANWFEREAYDMYGIIFMGHPFLRRILMHDDFVGHPLRKDYPMTRRQRLSKPTRFAEESGDAGR